MASGVKKTIVKSATYTTTTGTDSFEGRYYYANIQLPAGVTVDRLLSFYVVQANSNRVTTLQAVISGGVPIVRVYTRTPSVEVTVKVNYI